MQNQTNTTSLSLPGGNSLASSTGNNPTSLSTAAHSSECYLEPGQCETLITIKRVLLSISIAALVTSISSLIILRKYRFFTQRVILSLLISNLLTESSLIAYDGRPETDETVACTIQGFLGQYFGLVEFFLFCNLTVILLLVLVKDKDTENFEWVYMVVGWGVPLLISFLPFIDMDYGPADAPFCWLKGDIWRFGVYWVPVMVGQAVIAGIFVYMIWHTKRAMRRYTEPHDQFTARHMNRVRNYLKPLATYAVTFWTLNLVPIANRIQNAISPSPIFGLVVFHTIIFCSYGMILSILFVITNGRKELTIGKFKNGILFHIKYIRSCGKKARTDNVVVTSITRPNVQQMGEMGEVDNAHSGLSVPDGENMDDSGIAEPDTGYTLN